MVGLLDIAPAVERVEVRGTQVDVFGISVKGIVSLIQRFPELRGLIGGESLDVDVLMSMGGDIVAAIIAAGCGSPGDVTAEKTACALDIGAQADLLVAILRVTMPGGVGPFVAKLSNLSSLLNLQSDSLNSIEPTTRQFPNGAANDQAAHRPT